MMTRREFLALSALAGILVITAGWWALALWPSGPSVPEWFERARFVCFGVTPGGLPHAGGWLLLVGEPLGMLGFLFVVWGGAVRDGLSVLLRSLPGRAVVAGSAALVLIGASAAMKRVSAAEPFDTGRDVIVQELGDRPAPPLRLAAHTGDVVDLASFLGRPVIVAFAYAHCQTVCPLIVHESLKAQRLAAAAAPLLLVVTLDPWRDTPERLPHIARQWQLGEDAFLLGGPVHAVESVLAEWGVPYSRDERTGEVTHPTNSFLVDRAGRLRHTVQSDAAAMAAVLSRY
jgi:cytochrome oxidase Cu insertion factor (SCO1/SenC/PrrC family)